MGLLDNLQNMATSQSGDSGSSASGILEMIQNHPGGLSGLVQSFHANGLGDLVNSWVGTGQNQPASSDQIQQALGSGPIQAFAQKMGISPDAAGSTLAQFLPMIIDKLTPNGSLPSGQSNLLEMGQNFLGSLGKTGS